MTLNPRYLLAIAALLMIFGFVVSTGAVTSGDEVVNGVYMSPSDGPNGEVYTQIDDTGQMSVELTNLNPKSRTIVDDVFTISTSNDYSRVWIEHDSESVEFYRMDARQPIDSPENAVELSAGETIHVGIGAVARNERLLLEEVTIRAEIERGGDDDTVTTTPMRTDTATPTDTPTTTATPTPTTTTDAPDTDTPTPGAGNETTARPTTVRNGSAGTPGEAVDTSSETPAPTATQTSTPQVTVSTPTQSLEIGGLSPLQLTGLAALLVGVGLGLLAWRAGGATRLTVAASPDSGLDVAPDGLDPDHYERTDGGFRFRFAETETWQSAAGESAASFPDALTLTNTGSEAVTVVADAERGFLDDVTLLVGDEGVDLSDGALTLAGGESVSVSVTIPSDFDGGLAIRFDAVPGE